MPTVTGEIELLCPARDAVCAFAAIGHGADAVYVGGPSFGARRGAANEISEIEGIVRYAHRYRAKVYAAMNTILHDRELDEAADIAARLWEAGVDALIVQDMAFLEMDLPPVALHASTQCDNRTPEKVRFLQDSGFSRVILARELTPDEIAGIRAVTTVELECFVHGALCVCHSGQCYLSARMTGRSANRGECAQPCRLPGELREGSRILADRIHPLSLKDMSRLDSLERLIEAGVTSFKIEGRLKDEGYVGNITALYRRELDRILEGRPECRRASSGSAVHNFTPDPSKTFNRGYTHFWPDEEATGLASFRTPKHLGEPVGEVLSASGRKLVCNLEAEISNGDGLAWFDRAGELKGFRVNSAENGTLHIGSGETKPAPGARLYRNLDTAFEKALSLGAERKIAVDAKLSEAEGGFALKLVDEDGFSSTAGIECPHEDARDASSAEMAVQKLLARLGDTIFRLKETSLAWEKPRFIPPAKLNAARREAVEKLEAAREAGYVRPPRLPETDPPPRYPEARLNYTANVSNALARRFYERHGAVIHESAFESSEPPGETVLMTSIHCLRRELDLCPKGGAKGAGPLTLILGSETLTLTFDCGRCVMTVTG